MRDGFWLRAAVAAAATMVVCLGALYGYLLATGGVNVDAADLVTYYSAAKLVVSGHGASIYNFAAINRTGSHIIYPFRPPLGGVGPFLYPPWFALVVAPLALVPYGIAYGVWFVVNISLAVCALLALARFAGLRALQAALFVLLGLSCLPIFAALGQGQVSVLILALLVSVLWALRAGHDVAAGSLLALALIKPQYALPVAAVLLLQRRWRGCATFVGCAAALSVLPIPILGGGAQGGYLHALARFYAMHGHAAYLPAPRINYGLPGFTALLAPAYSTVVQIAVATGALLLTAWVALRQRTVEVPFALAIAFTLLASPHVLIYDVSLLILPLAVLLHLRPAWSILGCATYAAPLAGLVLHLGVPLTVPMMALTVTALVRSGSAGENITTAVRGPTEYLFYPVDRGAAGQ